MWEFVTPVGIKVLLFRNGFCQLVKGMHWAAIKTDIKWQRVLLYFQQVTWHRSLITTYQTVYIHTDKVTNTLTPSERITDYRSFNFPHLNTAGFFSCSLQALTLGMKGSTLLENALPNITGIDTYLKRIYHWINWVNRRILLPFLTEL